MYLLDFQAGTSASLKNPRTGVHFSMVSTKASACKHILYKQFACLNSFHERASWTRGHSCRSHSETRKITMQRALSTYPEAMVSSNKTCRPISTCCLLHVMKREVYVHKLLSLLPERSIFAQSPKGKLQPLLSLSHPHESFLEVSKASLLFTSWQPPSLLLLLMYR